MIDNPWAGMSPMSQRRINSESKFDLLWVMDNNSSYCLCLKISAEFEEITDCKSLKGITIVKRNSPEGHGEFFMILHESQDWEIFYSLCMDLVGASLQIKSEEQLLIRFENRLERWRYLLRSNPTKLSYERQMGLFAELMFLKEYVMKVFSIEDAVAAWVGPDFDKQDFMITDQLIEVKSYKISKGEIVTVSSLHQLMCASGKLTLVAFGLSGAPQGVTVLELSDEIKKNIKSKDCSVMDDFENKLAEYGLLPAHDNDELVRFIYPKVKSYAVDDKFPKILRNGVDSRIPTASYTIDLTLCLECECSLEKIFER